MLKEIHNLLNILNLLTSISSIPYSNACIAKLILNWGSFKRWPKERVISPIRSIDLKDSPAGRFYYACKPTVKKEQEFYRKNE